VLTERLADYELDDEDGQGDGTDSEDTMYEDLMDIETGGQVPNRLRTLCVRIRAKRRTVRLAGSESALSDATSGAARLSNLLQICSST
jgi:hypothetical protein